MIEERNSGKREMMTKIQVPIRREQNIQKGMIMFLYRKRKSEKRRLDEKKKTGTELRIRL